MNLMTCPLMGKECHYADCMLFNRTAAQCSVSVIATELQAISADVGALTDSMAEIAVELPGITAAVKSVL